MGENDKKKTRFFEISLLNVFFCMLVVFIHTSSKTISDVDRNSWQYAAVMVPWRLSAFVVQGFIFLSGVKLFIGKSNGIAYGKFLVNRLRNIVLPYIIWVFIYYVYFCSENYFPFDLVDFLGYLPAGNLVSHFYFIIIIVQFYLSAPLWFHLVKQTNPVISVLFSLMLTIVLGQNLPDIIRLFFGDFHFKYTDRVFTTYLIYWTGGCYAGLYYENFKELLHNNRRVLSAVFLISASCNAILSYFTFTGRRNVHWLENLHIMYCISAVLFFYMISFRITQVCSEKAETYAVIIINSIDKISYGIYLAHCLVIFMVNDFLLGFPGLSIGESYLIRMCTVYIITIGVLLLWKAVKNQAVSRLPLFKK